MTTRTCNSCGNEKDEDQFPWKRKNGAAPRRHAICKQCTRAYSRDWHRRNSTVIQAKNSERSNARNERSRQYRKHRRDTLEGHLVAALAVKKGTCRRKKIACTITVDHLLKLYEEQKGLCCLTWRTLEWGPGGRARYRLSLDRLDSYNGYVPGNVRLVTLHANVARADFGDIALLELAHDLMRVGGPPPEADEAIVEGPVKWDWRPRRLKMPDGSVKLVLWSKQGTPESKLRRKPPEGERAALKFFGSADESEDG